MMISGATFVVKEPGHLLRTGSFYVISRQVKSTCSIPGKLKGITRFHSPLVFMLIHARRTHSHLVFHLMLACRCHIHLRSAHTLNGV